MKKLNKVLIIIVSIFLFFFASRFLINELSKLLYTNKVYNDSILKPLYILNIQEPYIVYYNNGNYSFRKKDFNDAIDNYKKSLEMNPPKSRVCDIRVNLSLATIININSSDKNIIKQQLELAKSYLLEDDCAREGDEKGSSEEADELEEEISEMEDNIENDNTDDESNDNDDEKDKDDGDDGGDEDYSDIEEQLKNNNKGANGSRQEDLDTYENFGDFEYYSGKRW